MRSKPFSRKLRQLKFLRKQYDKLELRASTERKRLEKKMYHLARELQYVLGKRVLKPILPFAVACMLGFQVDAQQFAEPVLNPFGLEFTGDGAFAPQMVDIDNDGDLDMFLAGYMNDNDSYTTYFYYENVGSATNPQFGEPEINPFGLDDLELPYLFSTFGDLDDDGDLDLMHFVGFDSDTMEVNYFWVENTRTPEDPSFTAATPIDLHTRFAPDFASLDLADMDEDGDLDLIGSVREFSLYNFSYTPRMSYFENIGSPQNPVFDTIDVSPFDSAFFEESILAHSIVGDLDTDGDLDLLSTVISYDYGTYYGSLKSGFSYFENNSPTDPQFEDPVDSPFDLPEVDSNLVVFDLADVDGDGDLDIIGTTYFYSYDTSTIDFVLIENLDLTPVDLVNGAEIGWSVFPNPTNDAVNLHIPDASLNADGIQIGIYNILGREVRTQVIKGDHTRIDMSNCPPGQYYIRSRFSDKVVSLPIMVAR